MPRQLKVIANNVTENAPFRVNWTTPVIIKPGNKITMDKFVAIIPDITANFALTVSTFEVYLQQNATNYESITPTIPAQNYSSVSTLLDAMTIQTNNGFSGYVKDMLPTGAGGRFNWYRDAGLKMQFVSDLSKMLFQYVTCPRTILNLSGTNMSQNALGMYYPNTASATWTLQQIITANVVCRGGGLLVRTNFKFPTVQDAIDDVSSFIFGLNGNDGTFRGIGQRDDGSVFLRFNEVEVNIPSAWLDSVERMTMDFYQAGGFFQVRIYENGSANLGNNTNLFDSATDGFETALGPVNYNVAYNLFGTGEKLDLTADLPSFGNTTDMTVDIAFNVPPSPGSLLRTCALDFSGPSSSQLRAGLDVPNGRLICTPQLSAFGSYTATNTINMALINTFFDIALEILDIPLETYQADTSGFPGSRKNILAYFRPELTQVGSNTYRFDVNIFDWLDIPITYDLNLTSCSFRLLNPDNNSDLKFSSCSFNLLINDKEY